MKQFLRRGAALGLALAMTVTAASASQALGWDLHTGTAPISVGTTLTTNYFWSDTYSDLRTEHYVEYVPSADVTPTVAYGTKVTDRITLTGMAQQLESQGKRVVSGLNGDWYVLSTGSPVGIIITDGVVRAAGYYSSNWAIGFYEDGTAFIAQNGLSMSVTLGGATLNLSGGINKVRKMTSSDGSGGLTLLTSDFADTTKNSEAGVDVISLRWRMRAAPTPPSPAWADRPSTWWSRCWSPPAASPFLRARRCLPSTPRTTRPLWQAAGPGARRHGDPVHHQHRRPVE